ncbi:BnaA09g31030D [Brassica napus]|uniref:BnaA09g31030D protein n=1 Tax=Brassica napus TaxID=3708 RepID=A0A078I3M0_BRANA|nr:BnaA09g31030D [Brassica napus]
MRGAQALNFLRRTTTLAQHIRSTAATRLEFGSCLEANPNDRVYTHNRKIDDLLKSGDLISAHEVFDEMSLRDVITYNLMISGNSRNGCSVRAFELYAEMVSHGLRESASTFPSVLSVCSGDEWLCREGIQVHCRVIFLGFECNMFVRSALVGLYASLRLVDVALKLFDEMPERNLAVCNLMLRCFGESGDSQGLFGTSFEAVPEQDVISWNSIVSVFSDYGSVLESLGLFRKMQFWGKRPSVRSFMSFLSFCSRNNDTQSGKQIHCCVLKMGFDVSSLHVQSALIDMYGKCNDIESSVSVFDELDSPNVFSWTSIINSYARNGMGRDCVEMLKEMDRKNLVPDEVTILSVLSGCSHSGLVKEGEVIFNSLESKYGIVPGRKLYACMVDLLGRAGLVEKAEKLLLKARGDADCIAWSSLLQSCRVHGNEAIGRRAAEVLMDLEPDNFAVYIQVSKFYFEIGDFEISRRIREIAASRELMREIGYSSVTVRN